MPFLNSKPLFYMLEKGIINSDLQILSYPPNILSEMLKNRSIDLGLIPVAELLTGGRYKIVPDISISSNGKVDSVILISEKELRDISLIALDNRSQSSSNLIKVIYNNFLGLEPEFVKRDYNEHFLTDVDAGMLIGDAGLRFLYSGKDKYSIYDLGELWTEYTGLPFVYAVLAVNDGINLGDELENIYHSKTGGINLIDKICEEESLSTGIDKEICINYVKNRIRYDLGEDEIAGIREFARCLNSIGIKARQDRLEFYGK